MMIKNEVFRHVEKCLYEYHASLARLEVLKGDLKNLKNAGDVHAQSYENTRGTSGIHSDPVFAFVGNVEKLEAQIRRLERNTSPITKLISDLQRANKSPKKEMLLKILELFYFKENSLSTVMEELHISRKMLYFYRKKLITSTCGYLGF